MTLIRQPTRSIEWEDPTYEAVAWRILGLFGVVPPWVGRTPPTPTTTRYIPKGTSPSSISGMCATGRHRRCGGIMTNGRRCTCPTCQHYLTP